MTEQSNVFYTAPWPPPPSCPNCNDPACADNEGVYATAALSVFVPGQPAPQGSKRHVGKGVLVESSKAVKPWRESVRWQVLDAWAGREPLAGALAVELLFVMKRPVATPKSRTPAAIRKPDIDKLARAILDAVGSAGLWGDDAQVVALSATKQLAELGGTPGCHITIYPAEEA